MPLIVSERDAAKIIMGRIERGSNGGNINFARVELGAHAEQAARIVNTASRILEGDGNLDSWFSPISEPIQVTKEVDGKELTVTLKADKLPITSYQELVDFYEIDTEVWRPASQVFNFWGNESSPNFQVKARFERDPYTSAVAEDREAFREWAAEYSPEFYVPPSSEMSLGGRLLEIMVADLHVDRFVEGLYGVKEAELRFCRAVMRIAADAAVVGPLQRIVLVLNGDTFNSDNSRGTTTAGTPQDMDGSWRTSFTTMRAAVARVAEWLSKDHRVPVEIRVLWGNHDREKSFYLADSLWSYFHAHPWVDVVTDSGERQYLEFGKNLIGFTHGDRVKSTDLAMTMFREAPTQGKKFMQWHMGHIHTAKSEEVHGVHMRWFRSPAEPDEWSTKNLYGHNMKDIVGILWDAEQGDVAEFRQSFEEAA